MFFSLLFLGLLIQSPEIEKPKTFVPQTFFELSQEMKDFLDEHIVVQTNDSTKLTVLFQAIFDEDKLGMTYSNHQTTNPRETFALRTGNCLSFTGMFIAMARYCGVNALFQEVSDLSSWSKKGDYTVFNRHMNCVVFVNGQYREVDFNYLDKKKFRFAFKVSDQRGIAHFYNNLGAEALSQDNNELAQHYFQQSLVIDPKFSYGWTNLGIVHRISGNYDEAEKCYIKADKLSSRNYVPKLNLALLYSLQGRDKEATLLRKKVKKFLNKNPYHHYALGQSAYDTGDFELAIKHLKRAVRLHGTHPHFHLALAAAYEKSGNTKKAKKHINKLIAQAKTFDQKALFDRKLQLLASTK